MVGSECFRCPPAFTEDQATAYFIHKGDPETLPLSDLAGVTHGKKACDVEKVIFGPEIPPQKLRSNLGTKERSSTKEQVGSRRESRPSLARGVVTMTESQEIVLGRDVLCSD